MLHAVKSGFFETAKYLLNFTANINAKSQVLFSLAGLCKISLKGGETVLMGTAAAGSCDLLDILIEKGASIVARDEVFSISSEWIHFSKTQKKIEARSIGPLLRSSCEPIGLFSDIGGERGRR